ncbi:hypothetical protein AVEN_192740-1 [Araneus ventricosus]|uniref:Uncharacterized protein n=1 Tax=Araneus ventricosus TaxID=182803 RepID=A0A4Y2KRX5_ARAVE|nr:hypothetical protein AVEN_192740-1 [Araneus ventricosus]
MMDFKCVPSLEYLTGVKIGVAIIHNPDVTNLALDPRCDFDQEILKEVFDILGDKIQELILPTECCKKIKIITMNMIQELLTWRRCHLDNISPSQISMTYFCWTTIGAIDELKTARKFLNGLYLDIVSQFRLACDYCFFYDVSTIWEAMSEEEKQTSNNGTFLDSWIRDCREGSRSLESFIRWIEPKLADCNKYTLLFILDKKTPAERIRILRTAALSEDFSREFRIFCFQQLDEDAQQEVLEKVPVEVLRCFLRWPFQSFFLHLADRIWTNISPADFCDIIHNILCRLVLFLWQNFELVEILQQLWHRSPSNFKDYANQSSFSEVLNILLNCNCAESLNIYRLNESFLNHLRSPHRLAESPVVFFDMDPVER